MLGAKVRALTEGRCNASLDDIRALAQPALRHRVIMNFAGESEGVDGDDLISQVMESVEGSSARAAERLVG